PTRATAEGRARPRANATPPANLSLTVAGAAPRLRPGPGLVLRLRADRAGRRRPRRVRPPADRRRGDGPRRGAARVRRRPLTWRRDAERPGPIDVRSFIHQKSPYEPQ